MAKVKPPVGLLVGARPRGYLVSVRPVACDKYTCSATANKRTRQLQCQVREKALPISRSFQHPRHSDVIRSMAGVQEEEFDEGEVWDVLQDQVGMEVPRIATPPRNRRAKQKVASIEGARKRSTARLPSAPVAIPAAGGSSRSRRRGGDKPQEDEDGGEMLPPHEWLARKMERMGGVSSPASPPEACGGRSKGREMRKVRDAVLPKTAFSEQ
ncbi:hypothetical protein PR202_gb20950 [Eleusine coracana subsp. coracana]|uniref:Uncharacterized protein n=1 Tax=Eleusine coracana subsp. coracana TaxID=191504 RepID=A0AAV5F9W0_ELECO|nr:hypothetical protein PR202_gb20950 [Eleusine coracana subsp. coracana]